MSTPSVVPTPQTEIHSIAPVSEPVLNTTTNRDHNVINPSAAETSSLIEVPVTTGPNISSLPKTMSASVGNTSKTPSLRTVKVRRRSIKENMLVDVNLTAENSQLQYTKKRNLSSEEDNTSDGTDTLLWSDPWLSSVPCYTPTVQFQRDTLSLKRVCDIFEDTGRAWDKELISQTFSPKDAQQFLATHLDRGVSKDKWKWRLEKSGAFTDSSVGCLHGSSALFGCLSRVLLGVRDSLLILV
ncbi:ribonuclease H-like superfamily protein [Striga asiatica]|uniref:Ribonuclease H-like superfamily protein n=1 Tax=Striga asiatica TaxID=4170 RepID=A0A5A7Q4F5_STRAF|nr:ribonuclease H-like superfamily protein [Striga asiatica]